MSQDPKKSLSYTLGVLEANVQFLVDAERARQESDKSLDARVSSLEHFKFKLVFIVGAVGATVGFLFSNVKEGIVWLKEVMA